jgi:hypothetical protein
MAIPKLSVSFKPLRHWTEVSAVKLDCEIVCTNGFRVLLSPDQGKSSVVDHKGDVIHRVRKVVLTADGNSAPTVEIHRSDWADNA